MKKINILKKNNDFSKILNKGQRIRKPLFNIYYINKNKDEYFKIGISVSKKLGNAVLRNKIKRRIKNILNKKRYKQGMNFVIITKKEIINQNYDIIEKELIKTLKQFEQ